MAIKKLARKASRKAVTKAKRAGRKVAGKSGKKVKLSTKRRGQSSKTRTSRKKRVSRKSRVTRKRRRTTKKKSAARKRRATKKSAKKRVNKKKAAQAVKVDEKKAPATEPVPETVSTDLGSISLGSYEVELTEAGEVAIPKKEVAETPNDTESGYDLRAAESEQPVENDVQTPGEWNPTESTSADVAEPESYQQSAEPESVGQSAEPESVAQSAEPESAAENDYVVVNREDADSSNAVEEEESVPVEEPVMVNDNPRYGVQQQEERDYRKPLTGYDDSSSQPSLMGQDAYKARYTSY